MSGNGRDDVPRTVPALEEAWRHALAPGRVSPFQPLPVLRSTSPRPLAWAALGACSALAGIVAGWVLARRTR